MRSIQIIYIFIFALGTNIGFSQAPTLSTAEHLVNIGEYEKAIDQYNKLDILSNSKAVFYKGYCHFKLREIDKAENHFLAAHNLKYKNHQLLFLMGQIRQAEGKYKEATKFYKEAFKSCNNDADSKRIINALSSCSNSEKMEFNETGNIAVNLGEIINSAFDETYPLPSPTNDGLIYFSSSKLEVDPSPLTPHIPRKRNAEIYKAKISDFLVLGIDFASEHIRSEEDEYILDITENGKVLFFLKGNERKEIMTDTFANSSANEHKMEVLSSIVQSLGQCEFDVIQDSIFVFSSDKPGGFGGYDLYFSLKRGNTWLEGINLGENVNSPFDEVSPFLTKGSKGLYFSSNRDGGLGGYDVYRSDYSDIELDWTNPKNVGIPINSSQDDMNFKVSLLNPKTAFISSNRLLNNFGGFDIYQIELRDPAWTNYTTNAPVFFSEYMGAQYTNKTFKTKVGNQIISTDDATERQFLEDSLRLVAFEQERIIREQEVLDSLIEVKKFKDAQRIQDSLILVQVEQENLKRQQQVRDSLLAIQIEKELLVEQKRIQDSLAIVQLEEQIKLDAQREKDKLIAAQIAEAKRLRELAIQDSLRIVAIEEEKRQDQKRAELARIAEIERQREQRTQDSLRIVQIEIIRLKREKFVLDSLAYVQSEKERVAREKQIQIQKTQDSIRIVQIQQEKMIREQFVRDSIAMVQLAERKMIQEERTRDSLLAAKFEEEKMFAKQRQKDSLDFVKLQLEKLQAEEWIRDSLLAVQAEREKLLAVDQTEVAQDSSYAPLSFHTITLDSPNGDSGLIVENEESIDILRNILNSYPNAIAEIEGFHKVEGPSKVYDLFSSIKRAELLKEELIGLEIDGSKIFIKGHGSQFNETNIESDSDKHDKVLVRVFNTDLARHIPDPEEALVNEDTDTKYFNDYISTVKGIKFRVEAIRIKRMLSNRALDVFDDILLEQEPNDKKYAYMFGLYDNIDEAVVARRELIASNFKNPQIIPYLNGSRITEQQVRFIVDQYPSLEAYLRYVENGQ